jgi:hypothetical protein
MVGKRSAIEGSEGLSASRANFKDKKNPIWKEKGLDTHRPRGLFPPRMKKVCFIITPAQHDAFERVRKASPLGVEPAAAVARRLFLIGLSQAGVTKTTKPKK